MKKALILLVALGLTFGSQAQIGNLVGSAVKKGIQKSVEKKVEQTVDEKLGVRDTKQIRTIDEEKRSVEEKEKKNKVPTPEEVMGMVPQIPSAQQLAEYACEQNRANPRTLKMLANPTAAFSAKMIAAMASGYVTMMGSSKEGSIYAFDEQLLKEFGISEEKYEAMSEEEQQELANKYAAELQDRYIRTAEHLQGDAEYNKLMDKYIEVEKEISAVYDRADADCLELWKKSGYEAKAPSENQVCDYFKEAVPIQYNAVLVVMKMRKTKQLDIAKQIDRRVQQMAKEQPGEVYAGFYNQGGICATSYVSDAARLTSLSTPR